MSLENGHPKRIFLTFRAWFSYLIYPLRFCHSSALKCTKIFVKCFYLCITRVIEKAA